MNVGKGGLVPPFYLPTAQIYDALRSGPRESRSGEVLDMDWMLMPLRRYAEFSGRSRRKEFWMFFLFQMIVAVVLGIIEGMLGLTGMVAGAYGPLTLLFWLAVLVPGIAVAIRRMHDQDRSGWWILVPIVNLVFYCLEGTKGDNRFGPDPKGTAPAQAFT
jgi:uncharacterized membrane protein YhaH (DUF805 family)